MSNWSYFGSYEYFKQRFAPADKRTASPLTPARVLPPHMRLFVGVGAGGKLSMGASVLSGGLAGICYWLSCYPMDVIKARLLGTSFSSLLL
jgi:hypothetical protein